MVSSQSSQTGWRACSAETLQSISSASDAVIGDELEHILVQEGGY